jgi:hypothetical protein
MALFHVYVEAPDRAPETIKRLAETIGKKYGVPVADLEKRLTAGRFRVKANVDRETAEVYAKALGEHGAIVKIEDAVATPAVGTPVVVAPEPSGAVARAPAQLIRTGTTTPPANLPARPSSSSLPPRNASAAPRPSSSSLPPATASRTATSSLPPPNQNKSAPIVMSGLSAAYNESATTDLGALGTDSLSLAPLDGSDPVSDDAFAPPVDLSPTVDKPSAKPPAGKAKAKANNDPVDLFAPPEAAEDAAFKVELATDEVEHRAKKMSTPPAGVPVPIGPSPSTATPQLGPMKKRVTPAVGAPITVAPDAQEAPRWRFAAGVVLAIILGFIPAHLIASAREKSAFARIDREVMEQQEAADSPDLYEALDAFRSAKQAQKQGEKRSIAMLSMLIWGVTGAGLAYVWFRRVPWDKLSRSA